MKIVIVLGSTKFKAVEFPVVPRVGDHITLKEGMEPLPVEMVDFRLLTEHGPVQIEIVLAEKGPGVIAGSKTEYRGL